MDEKSSWLQVLITLAIDWRLVMAIVILVVFVLLLKEHNLPGGRSPSGSSSTSV